MNKKQRLKVYHKYDDQCAYCGNNLEYKNMQVDHLHPMAMKHWYNNKRMVVAYDLRGDNIDSFENLMPSCRRCNHYKRSYRLDEFRKLMVSLHERISDHYINKVAIDFGIIKLTPFDGRFWFEVYEEYMKL